MKRIFIPASPGFFTVERLGILHEGTEIDAEAFLCPVVAWQLEDDEDDGIAVTTPVTTTGTDTVNPIVFPDGRVVKPEGYDFESVEKWLHHMNEERRAQQKASQQ